MTTQKKIISTTTVTTETNTLFNVIHPFTHSIWYTIQIKVLWNKCTAIWMEWLKRKTVNSFQSEMKKQRKIIRSELKCTRRVWWTYGIIVWNEKPPRESKYNAIIDIESLQRIRISLFHTISLLTRFTQVSTYEMENISMISLSLSLFLAFR